MSTFKIYTHDLKLKRRLFALCEEYPDVCELIDVDEHGGHCFLADKERISIHVTGNIIGRTPTPIFWEPLICVSSATTIVPARIILSRCNSV